MTTIAYRDGILAGDSGLYSGTTLMALVEKVFKFGNGILYGGAGDGDDNALRKLLGTKGIKATKVELAATHVTASALIVLPNKHVYYLSIEKGDNGEFEAEIVKLEGEYFSVGAGADFALGAMAQGASAIAAVTSAAKHNIYTELPVNTVKLNG